MWTAALFTVLPVHRRGAGKNMDLERLAAARVQAQPSGATLTGQLCRLRVFLILKRGAVRA